jgi:lipoyl-dependent peroxiredoxin
LVWGLIGWNTGGMAVNGFTRATPGRVRLGAVYAAHGASHGVVLVFAGVLVALRAEFGSSFTTLGTVATVAGLLYGVGALPAGILADRFGPPVVLRTFAWLTVVGCLLAAAAPSVLWLGAALAFIGAAGALYHPAGLSELTFNAPGEGGALGVHGGWGSVGTAFAPLLAGAIASALSWRVSYLAAALLAVVIGVAIQRGIPVHRELPSEAAAVPGERDRRVLTVVMLLATAEGFVFQGFVIFLPAFLAELSGSGPAAAARGGALSAAVLLLGAPGQVLGGRLAGASARVLSVRYAAVYLGAVGTGIAVGVVGSSIAGLALAALFSLLIFVGQPLTNQLVSRSTTASRRGIGYGTYFALSFGFGSLAGSAGGIVADRSGLPAVFVLLGAVAVINVVGGLVIRALSAPEGQTTRPVLASDAIQPQPAEGANMPKAERQAHAVWAGDLISGEGDVELVSSGTGSFPVTWASRVESPDGRTSPEELVAAAHAACYAMAFSNTLAQAGNPPDSLHVVATVSLDDKQGGGVEVTSSRLDVSGVVPGLDQAGFQSAAEQGEAGCPISNALRGNVAITVTATLDN